MPKYMHVKIPWRFCEGLVSMNVTAIAINDNFQVSDEFGGYNDRIFMVAVPYIGGFNPGYSGLDFCEAVSAALQKLF